MFLGEKNDIKLISTPPNLHHTPKIQVLKQNFTTLAIKE